MMVNTKATTRSLASAALCALLAACGAGGGGSGAPGAAVSGVARTDQAVVGVVTVKDSSSPPQTRTVATAPDGAFSVDVTGMAAPFLLKAQSATGGAELFSLAEREGISDLNRLTDLAFAGAAGRDGQDEFEGSDREENGRVRGRLVALLTQLRTVLAPLFDLYHLTDPRTDRAAVRAMLRDVAFAVSAGVLTVTNRATGGVIFTGPLSNLGSGTFHPENLPAGPGTPPPPGDGVALYSASCQSCHGPLATSSVRGASAGEIRAAIQENEGGMGSLSSLTSADLTAISAALSGATTTPPPPPPPPDGAALYATSCQACHGPLASSQVAGASAAAIQTAIDGNVGGMGVLSSLSSAQVSAISLALAGATTTPPPPPPPDGAALYAQYCAGCHGNSKKGRPASAIQAAIDGNTGGMGTAALRALTPAQVAAIAAAP